MLNPRKPTTSFHTTTKNTDSQRQRESTSTTVHNSTTRRDERPDRRYRAEENHTRQKNHNNSKPKSPIPKAPHSTSHTQAHSAYLSQREATCEWRASAGGRWSWARGGKVEDGGGVQRDEEVSTVAVHGDEKFYLKP